MSRIIAVLSRTAAAHSRIIAVMSRIYCDYFGARHFIGDDFTAILLLHTTVSDDFPSVALGMFLNRVGPITVTKHTNVESTSTVR